MKKKKFKQRVFYSVLAGVILIFLIVLSGKRFAGFLADAAGRLQKRAVSAVYYIKDSLRAVKYASAAREGIDMLNKRNNLLEAENNALAGENEKLRRLAKMAGQKDPRVKVRAYADVIGSNTDGFIQYVVIGAGSDAGVEEGDGVIAGNGSVFGRVAKVTRSAARVQLITDPKSSISVRDKRSRVAGIMNGRTFRECSLEFVPKEADVSEGDEVVTSGMGSAFPEGLLAGIVVNVNRKTDGLTMAVKIKPVVDVFSVEEVIVVRKQPGKGLND